MPNNIDSLEDKVHDWLKKSGYPLELFSHEMLIENGFMCEKSPLYTDIETGVEREIDITAEKSYGDCFIIDLLVECKKSEKPLVVLSSTPEKKSVRSEIYRSRTWPSEFSNASVLAEVGFELRVISNDLSLPFSRQVSSGYSLLQAFKSTDDLMHKKLYGLAKAEHYFDQQHESLFHSGVEDEEHPFFLSAFTISLLVVDAPLFNAFLDDGKLKVEETNWSSITLNLPWIKRPESGRRANIQVVVKEQLSTFLSELDDFSKWLSESKAIKNYEKQFLGSK